jgi:hypothetical protein
VKSSSQWMLIYKIVLKKFQAYTIWLPQNFDLVSGWKKKALRFSGC